MNYELKPEIIDAITFDEFVEYGKYHADNIVDGMPWSFEYKGYSVTHENNRQYLLLGESTVMPFNIFDMLVTDENGRTYPVPIDDFVRDYLEYRGAQL
jgi:hypothetical protein